MITIKTASWDDFKIAGRNVFGKVESELVSTHFMKL
jgi:hypothetical protein